MKYMYLMTLIVDDAEALLKELQDQHQKLIELCSIHLVDIGVFKGVEVIFETCENRFKELQTILTDNFPLIIVQAFNKRLVQGVLKRLHEVS
jgi:hypothetical protein